MDFTLCAPLKFGLSSTLGASGGEIGGECDRRQVVARRSGDEGGERDAWLSKRSDRNFDVYERRRVVLHQRCRSQASKWVFGN